MKRWKTSFSLMCNYNRKETFMFYSKRIYAFSFICLFSTQDGGNYFIIQVLYSTSNLFSPSIDSSLKLKIVPFFCTQLFKIESHKKNKTPHILNIDTGAWGHIFHYICATYVSVDSELAKNTSLFMLHIRCFSAISRSIILEKLRQRWI